MLLSVGCVCGVVLALFCRTNSVRCALFPPPYTTTTTMVRAGKAGGGELAGPSLAYCSTGLALLLAACLPGLSSILPRMAECRSPSLGSRAGLSVHVGRLSVRLSRRLLHTCLSAGLRCNPCGKPDRKQRSTTTRPSTVTTLPCIATLQTPFSTPAHGLHVLLDYSTLNLLGTGLIFCAINPS